MAQFLYGSYFPKIRSEKDFERYRRFILTRPARIKDGSEYVENHHILPKCYCKGKASPMVTRPDNLIYLTAEEHYRAHMLLWLAIGGKMTYAFHLVHSVAAKKGAEYLLCGSSLYPLTQDLRKELRHSSYKKTGFVLLAKADKSVYLPREDKDLIENYLSVGYFIA